MKYLPESFTYEFSSRTARALAGLVTTKRHAMLRCVCFTNNEGVAVSDGHIILWWRPWDNVKGGYSQRVFFSGKDLKEAVKGFEGKVSLNLFGQLKRHLAEDILDVEIPIIPAIPCTLPFDKDLVGIARRLTNNLVPKEILSGGMDPKYLYRAAKLFEVFGFPMVRFRPMASLEPFHFYAEDPDQGKMVVLIAQRT